MQIRRLDAAEAQAQVSGLAAVLSDCVEGGASIGFMDSLTAEEAESFFRGVAGAVESGDRVLLAAFDGDELLGTAQVILSGLPNGAHRAEIAKVLVHRNARRRGVAAALMERAEDEARVEGKTLLVLDAVTGGDAARLYARLGWTRVGEIPDFALFPDGRYCSTTYFYKRLS
jgi:GNAT superfamily N-acetyltransferase